MLALVFSLNAKEMSVVFLISCSWPSVACPCDTLVAGSLGTEFFSPIRG